MGNKTMVLLLLPVFLLTYQVLENFYGFHAIYERSYFGFWSPYIFLPTSFSQFSASFVVLLNAVGLNYLVNKNHFLERNTHLVSLIYIVFMSLFSVSYSMNGILISHALLIIMLNQLLTLNHKEDLRSTIFNCFLCLGLSTTFTPFFLYFTPIFWVPFFLTKPLSFREILIGLIAFSIPFLYYFIMVYVLGDDYFLYLNNEVFGTMRTDFWFIMIAISVFLAFAIIIVSIKSRTTKIQTNKKIRICIFLTFVFSCIALYQLLSFQQIGFMSFILIPLSILLIFSFISDSFRFVVSLLFYSLIAYSVMKFFIFLPIQDI